jgi:hypothetical protein
MSEGKGCMGETLEENGWNAQWVPFGPGPGAVPVGVAGYHDRYVVAPNYIEPSRGFLLVDDARRVVCIVPTLPTPRRAARLLAKYGTPLEAVVPSIDSMFRIPDEEA